jgi:hypothetical protein
MRFERDAMEIREDQNRCSVSKEAEVRTKELAFFARQPGTDIRR